MSTTMQEEQAIRAMAERAHVRFKRNRWTWAGIGVPDVDRIAQTIAGLVNDARSINDFCETGRIRVRPARRFLHIELVKHQAEDSLLIESLGKLPIARGRVA